MKQILVIGSTVVDVIINVDHLPVTGEDVNVFAQQMSMGGCAFNAFSILRHFGVPCTLFSPVGTGAYGDFVREHLAQAGIPVCIPTPQRDNGCCYCFVEAGGERTFISYHGAEYAFQKEWFELLNPAEIGGAYLCGLEVEEPTGGNILSFFEEHPEIQAYFAPGPRIGSIPQARIRRLLALHPVLHLNEGEALSAAALYASGEGADTVEEAAFALQRVTERPVIVTLGERGCWYETGGERGLIPAVATEPVDTIGAGDSHIGTVMARLALGDSLPRAIETANRVAAAVVGSKGARLSDAAFAAAVGDT